MQGTLSDPVLHPRGALGKSANRTQGLWRTTLDSKDSFPIGIPDETGLLHRGWRRCWSTRPASSRASARA